MKHTIPFCCFCAVLALLVCPAAAEVYTGWMNFPGDDPATLDVAGQGNGWPTGFSIDWQVSNEETGGPGGYDWFYDYTINVAKFAPSRLIVETAGSFTAANISTVKLYHNSIEQSYPSSPLKKSCPANNLEV